MAAIIRVRVCVQVVASVLPEAVCKGARDIRLNSNPNPLFS